MTRAYLFAAGFAAVVLAGLGVYVYRNRQLLNPASEENIANQAVTGIVQSLTGDQNQTLGGWLFDLFHPSAGLAEGEIAVAPNIIQGPERPSPSFVEPPNASDFFYGAP